MSTFFKKILLTEGNLLIVTYGEHRRRDIVKNTLFF